MRRWHGAGLYCAIALAAAAALLEVGRAVSIRGSVRARERLKAGDPAEAYRLSSAALAWYPYQLEAKYTQLVAMKRLNRWGELSAAAPRAARWHPDGPSMTQLAGEALWVTGRHGPAADWLWESYWRAPQPRSSPALLWRMGMQSSQRAWGPRDPRAAAAALRTWSLLPEDPTVSPADRPKLMNEAVEALAQSGAPQTGQYMREMRDEKAVR